MRQLIEIEWGWRDKWNDIQTNKQNKKTNGRSKIYVNGVECIVSFWERTVIDSDHRKYDHFIPYYLCCRSCGGMSKKEKFPVSNVRNRMNQFGNCAYKWTNNTIFDLLIMYNNYIEISQGSFSSIDRDRWSVIGHTVCIRSFRYNSI